MICPDGEPSELPSPFQRAVAAHKRNQLDKATGFYLQAIESEPNNADAWHLCGLIFYQLGKTNDAEHHIRAAIQLRPDNRDYHSNLGLVLKSKGENEEAVESFYLALNLDPEFADCLSNLGSTFLTMGRSADAEEVFRRLLVINPDHVEGCNNLAVVLAKNPDNHEPVALFEHALGLKPDYLDAHCNFARLLMRQDQFGKAIEHFQSAVKLDKSSASIRRKLGDALQKAGRLSDAMTECMAALELEPDNADSVVSVGNVHQSLGHKDKAGEFYRRALDIDPGNARAVNNIGTIFMHNGDVPGALKCFQEAVERDPEFVEAVFNSGTAMMELGCLKDAAQQFSKAIAQKPNITNAYRYLAETYRVLHMTQEQVAVLRQWMKRTPDSPTARHLLAAAEQDGVPGRASEDFIREEFDGFAESFESTLSKLQYRTPELLSSLLTESESFDGVNQSVLDAGCGTGLCGPFLHAFSARLTGVDLSQNMLDHAAKRDIYDELILMDLVAHMEENPSRYDLVVSADTFVYFGSLEHVFRTAAFSLKPGGFMAFSVEFLEGDSKEGFQLNASGRYLHSEDYVERCLNDSGFDIDVVEHSTLRTEMQLPVEGLIVLAHLT